MKLLNSVCLIPGLFVISAIVMGSIVTAGDDPDASLPAVLLEKVQRLFPGTVVDEVERDDADGEKRWEVTVRVPGSKLETEVKLLEDTTVTEIEEDLPEEGLPPAVFEAIRKIYPKAKFDESVRRHRVEITYEVEIEDERGKEKEIRLTRHGKILSIKND